MPRPRATTPTYTLTRRGQVYYVQWWQDGRANRTSCRTSDLGEARVVREALISTLGTPPPPISPTIGAVLGGYASARDGKVHSQAITYSSRALQRHLRDVPVTSLTARRIDAYGAARRKEGAGGAPAKHRKQARVVSDGTLRRELGVLRAALGWAIKAGWIKDAPPIELPPMQPARDRWLSKEEAGRLFAAAQSPHVRIFLALALFTAGRMTAILELTWDRVDMAAGLIQLMTGVVRKRKRRPRGPIADELRPYLVEAQAAATCAHVVEYRGAPLRSIKGGIRIATARAKLPGVTAHVMRHTAATWMVQAGISTAMVARYLGDTEAMVERHYGHHSPDWLRAGSNALTLKPRPVA